MRATDKTPEGSKSKKTASNTVTLDALDPIPIKHNGQLFTNVRGKHYVPFLNPKDNFAQLLTEAKLLSPTTLSCVTSKAQYCIGGGIMLPDGRKDELLLKWSSAVNRKQESLNEIMKGAFNDLGTAGNSYIEVVRGKIGSARFIKIYRKSFMDCRLAEPDDDDICNSVFYSKMFRKEGFWSLKPDKVAEIPIWSPNMFDNPWMRDEKGNEHTIFHLKNDMSGMDYYGLPANVASLPEQILEYKNARYNLDNFDNNLVIGGVIVVKGAMTDEEAKKIGKDIIYTHSGDGKRGRWVIVSSESGIAEGIDIKEFTKQTDGSFIESDKHNEEKIYIANQWNKLLIGGSESKNIGSGNSAYIRSVFDIANSTVIQPLQEYMITKFLQPLMQICDEHMGSKWASYKVAIQPLQPLSFLGDIEMNSVLTVDEGRELAGKEPLGKEQGGKIIKPGGSAKPDAAPGNNPTDK